MTRLIAAIRAQDADIVALQELSQPMADAIQQQLAAEYPYQVLMPAELDDGQGILSRYPLRDVARGPDFPGQRAIVDVDGQAITRDERASPRSEDRDTASATAAV